MGKFLYPLCVVVLLACGLPRVSAATYTLSNTNDLNNGPTPWNSATGVTDAQAYQIFLGGSGQVWAPTSIAIDSIWHSKYDAPTNNLTATISFYNANANGTLGGTLLGSVTSSSWSVVKSNWITSSYELLGIAFDTSSLTNSVQAFGGSSLWYSVAYTVSSGSANLNMLGENSTKDYGGGWGFGDFYSSGNWTATKTPAVSATFVTVPEPSTYALLGVGGLALVVAWRRRVA